MYLIFYFMNLRLVASYKFNSSYSEPGELDKIKQNFAQPLVYNTVVESFRPHTIHHLKPPLSSHTIILCLIKVLVLKLYTEFISVITFEIIPEYTRLLA